MDGSADQLDSSEVSGWGIGTESTKGTRPLISLPDSEIILMEGSIDNLNVDYRGRERNDAAVQVDNMVKHNKATQTSQSEVKFIRNHSNRLSISPGEEHRLKNMSLRLKNDYNIPIVKPILKKGPRIHPPSYIPVSNNLTNFVPDLTNITTE